MSEFGTVELSRLQFAVTALYHFLFVPLTLGLSFIIAIMESVFVMTGRPIWRDMTKFWGLLFGINFAMGVATGITMEFQFGMNWSYYSHYVGDVFGVPLAIEGMMAFFMEATFIGLFFFGWNRLSPLKHLMVTWAVAIASNWSALWILIANGWMQNPVGAVFNVETMRMEVTSFSEILFNPVAQAKVVHTVAAGYVTGSMFVLSISAWYLLRRRRPDFAKRSMAVAASFGLAAALSVVVLGDESGYLTSHNQKMKLAAIEAMWETQPAPASFTLIGLPDVAGRTTRFAVEIPWVMGIIGTRSLDTPIEGIRALVDQAKTRIRSGTIAYDALEKIRARSGDGTTRALFDAHVKDLGYALLLKRHIADPAKATDAEIEAAAWDTVPNVPVIFFSFRIMVACGMYFIALFALAFYLSARHRLDRYRLFLHAALWSLPLPWVAAELGWIVAEYGRQPWIIDGVLPTFLAASPLQPAQVAGSLIGFFVFYSALLVIDVFLMLKYIRLGPEKALGQPVALPSQRLQPAE